MKQERHHVVVLAPGDEEWRAREKARHEARREAVRRGMEHPEKWVSSKLLNIEFDRQAREGLAPERSLYRDGYGTEWEDIGETIRREELRRDILDVLPPYTDGGSPRPIGYGVSEPRASRGEIREAFFRRVDDRECDHELLRRASGGTAVEKRRAQPMVGSIVAELAKHWSMDAISAALDVPKRTLFRWRTKSGTNPAVT